MCGVNQLEVLFDSRVVKFFLKINRIQLISCLLYFSSFVTVFLLDVFSRWFTADGNSNEKFVHEKRDFILARAKIKFVSGSVWAGATILF